MDNLSNNSSNNSESVIIDNKINESQSLSNFANLNKKTYPQEYTSKLNTFTKYVVDNIVKNKILKTIKFEPNNFNIKLGEKKDAYGNLYHKISCKNDHINIGQPALYLKNIKPLKGVLGGDHAFKTLYIPLDQLNKNELKFIYDL